MKYLFALIVIGLFALNAFLGHRFYVLKDFSRKVEVKNQNLISENDALKIKLVATTKTYTPLNLPDDLTLTDIEGNEIANAEVHNILKKKLVFRFTERDCLECIKAELPQLKNLAESIGSENIVLLAAFSGPNDLKLLTENNQITFPIYKSQHSSVEKHELGSLHTPYVFFIDQNNTMRLFFSPQKEIPSLSAMYYNMVSSLFKDNAISK